MSDALVNIHVQESRSFCGGCSPSSFHVDSGAWRNHAKAPRDLLAGEVISENTPVACCLDGRLKATHCTLCFRQPIATEANLLRCSRCKIAHYCSSLCQKQDWKHHKRECEAGETINDEIRLLVRTLVAEKTLRDGCSASLTRSSHVVCGSHHLSALDANPNPIDAMETAIVRAAAQIANSDRSKSETLYRRFARNNFGVVDAFVSPLGAGVYPHAAILNHSCDPNCLIRFKFEAGVAPLLQIVAMRSIRNGEELTHAYVEMCQPTNVRREGLFQVYGFKCECRRCLSKCTLKLPQNIMTNPLWAVRAMNPCRVSKNSPNNDDNISATSTSTTMTDMDIEDAILWTSDPPPNLQLAHSKIQEAQTYRDNDDVKTEIVALRKAVDVLRCMPFNVDLYSARAALMSSLVAVGDLQEACTHCRLVVAFLVVAFAHVPNHPLLGLQLYTLGDLLSTAGLTPEARDVYLWSRHILRVCQGNDSEMVQSLDAILV
eukprot:m.47873 g.47873  ORF g.47873 m.47873 type:complete len:489 (+) comp20612_c0_seq1:238-1704(+)